jgi:hypothetical protein
MKIPPMPHPWDWVAHAAVGTAIWAAVFWFTHLWVPALILAAVAGLAKEVYDARHPLTHTSDVCDFTATVAVPVLLSILAVGFSW